MKISCHLHANEMKISCKQYFLMSGRYENQIAFVDCCLLVVFVMTYLESFISGDMVTWVHAGMSFMSGLHVKGL